MGTGEINGRVTDPSDHMRETVLPPSDAGMLDAIECFLAHHRQHASLVAPDGATTEIPDEIFELLRRVVDALARGQAVTVAPVSTRLTTSQAATMLGVSRPTLVRLLEDGALPYDQPRRHRTVRLDDVLAFKREQAARREATLAEMTRQSVADGLYGDAAEDYTDALREARRARDA